MSIAKVNKKAVISKKNGARQKFYSLKRNIEGEKRKYWLKAISINDPKGSKMLEKEKINMCYCHFHKSNIKNHNEKDFTIKLNAVPILHLTKDTVNLDSSDKECTKISRTFGMEDEIDLLEKDRYTNNN